MAGIGHIISKRVCARCYGDLSITHDGLGVECRECGEAWGGRTVSRRYAVWLGQRNLMEYSEVKRNMPDLFPPLNLSREQILSQLGF